MRKRELGQIERYPLAQSPLAQKPTQRDLAKLLGMKRDELRTLATYRDEWIIRRDEEINGKIRHLAYPRGRLRRVHELLKFHLDKVKQPDYVYSPRKQRSQRDNAALHVRQAQFLTLDIKQFYPSTNEKHFYRWAREELGMFDDVAGLLTRLVTVDGIASFGSPLTPVLATLVHRQMFDEIAECCRCRGLRVSLWVDDFTISGHFVPGVLLQEIREIIRARGLRSHKLQFRTGNRPVRITGLLVDGTKIRAPRSAHDRVRGLYADLANAESDAERDAITTRLLCALGSMRHISGKSAVSSMKAANQMNTLRRRRRKLASHSNFQSDLAREACAANDQSAPWA